MNRAFAVAVAVALSAGVAHAQERPDARDRRWVDFVLGLEVGMQFLPIDISITAVERGTAISERADASGTLPVSLSMELRFMDEWVFCARYEWSGTAFGDADVELGAIAVLGGYALYADEVQAVTVLAGLVRADLDIEFEDLFDDHGRFDPAIGPHVAARYTGVGGRRGRFEWDIEFGVRYLQFDFEPDATVIAADDHVGGLAFLLSAAIGWRF